MKSAGKSGPFLLAFIVALFWMGGCIGTAVIADYQYSNSVASYWSLSDKASTIQQKSEYLDKFVEALKKTRLADHDAIWLKTPDNSTDQNFRALMSLSDRMHDIINMDPKSFEYQQAMAQITGQEQGEAKNLLSRFEGAWYLEHHFFLWDWIGFVTGLVIVLALIITAFCAFSDVVRDDGKWWGAPRF